ncbi:MAG: FadR/GntR family transcriptional regulator [Pseudomonadota bacterium]
MNDYMSDRTFALRSPPRSRLRRQGSLAQQLAVQILKGELPPGHVFPGEIEFSGQLGISRSVLREALRILAAKGLIDSRPKAGTRVTARRHWSLLDPDLLAWQFEAEPTLEFLRDLFELRMVVEPSVAAFAAIRRTEAQVAEMGVALTAMAEHGLAVEAGRVADQRFHTVMLEASGNEAIVALSSTIMAAIGWTTVYKQRNGALPRDPVPEHRAVHAAIARRDATGAEAAMRELLRLALIDTEVSMGAG